MTLFFPILFIARNNNLNVTYSGESETVMIDCLYQFQCGLFNKNIYHFIMQNQIDSYSLKYHKTELCIP